MPNPGKCKGWVMKSEAPKWSLDAITFSPTVSVAAPSAYQVRITVFAAGISDMDGRRVSFPRKKKKPFVVAGESSERVGQPLPKAYHQHQNYLYPRVVGSSGSGVVDSVGAEAKEYFKVGDYVMFYSDVTENFGGSFCEYVLVDMEGVVKLPETETQESIIPLEQAAAMPTSVWPAYIALFDKLRVQSGHSIFIDEGASGIGAAAVQLAHACGVVVITACDAKNTEFVKSLGAQAVLDRQLGDNLIDTVLHLTHGYGVDSFLCVSRNTDAEKFSDVVRFGGALCLTDDLIVSQSSTLFTRQLSVHYVYLGGLYDHAVSMAQISYLGAQTVDLWQKKAFSMYITEVPLADGAKALDAVMMKVPQRGDTVVRIDA